MSTILDKEGEYLKNKRRKKQSFSVGENIKRLIKQNGYTSIDDFWSQKAQSHVSRSALHYIVNGDRDPRLSTLQRIAKLLDVEVGQLIK